MRWYRDMDILHVVLEVTGTSIPVEIVSALGDMPDINIKLVSEEKLPKNLPDTIAEEQILVSQCGFNDYGRFLEAQYEDFDIIHTHHVGPAAKVGYHSRDEPIHHVNTQHGHLHYTLEERAKNLPGLFLADTLIYNSHCTANSFNLFEQFLKFRANEHVVHNGVDTEAIGERRASFDKPSTVATAARLIPRKNISTLIQAFAHLDGLKLKIIGDGPQREELEQTTRRAGLSSEIEFVGYLEERAAVYDELANADIFALPSHGEGFCVAVAEAMAVGLPVVVSDIPIFHEVVGPSGVFINRNDPKAIANELARLSEDPKRARKLANQNRNRIHDRFTFARCAQGYRNVYEEIS